MLIDTAGWFCIFDIADKQHTRAVKHYETAFELVTHSYILAEFVALSEARKRYRPQMLDFLSKLMSDSDISVVWVDELLTFRAVELLTKRSDKIWSLCDAVSFIIMEDRGISEALTTDRDFEQAGFIRLLNS